jgi:hypothetical protein
VNELHKTYRLGVSATGRHWAHGGHSGCFPVRKGGAPRPKADGAGGARSEETAIKFPRPKNPTNLHR